MKQALSGTTYHVASYRPPFHFKPGVNGAVRDDGKIVTQSSTACIICNDDYVLRYDRTSSWRVLKAVQRPARIPPSPRLRIGLRPRPHPGRKAVKALNGEEGLTFRKNGNWNNVAITVRFY